MKALTHPHKQLLNSMVSGFENYAATFGSTCKVGALIDSPEQTRALIISCGAEYCRILDGKAEWDYRVSELRKDLLNLIKRGCPVRDIIHLSFVCTRGWSLTISDSLRSVGLCDPTLDGFKAECQRLARRISVLNKPQVPGPLGCLPELLPEQSDEDRARLRADIQRLPELLELFCDLWRMYQSQNKSYTTADEFYGGLELGFFYLLIKHFHRGHPTLSLLLSAMRQARDNVAAAAQGSHQSGRGNVAPKKQPDSGEHDEGDSFSAGALQKAQNRFSHDRSGMYIWMKALVMLYMSDEFSEGRASGPTLIGMLPKLHHTLFDRPFFSLK
jgi:hypothetical protein